jgi:anti-sigma factor RsiW
MSCANPIAAETLVSYWAGDLPPPDEAAVEEHLMGCAACTRESERIAAVTEAVRRLIPTVLSRAAVDELRRKGLRIDERPTAPGRTEVHFPRGLDLVILRLGGLDLSRAARVGVDLRPAGEARTITRVEDAPFDRRDDAVLLACQRHFDVLPADIVAEVRVVDESGAATTTSFTLVHHFA